jgi:hypothetical protein
MSDLNRIDERISELNMELAELQTAARVLRRLGGHKDQNGSQDTGKKTICDLAKEILLEAGDDGLHFTEIAKRAASQGYKGRRGSTDKTVAKSFSQTMHRVDSIFASMGQGRFRLK